MIDTAVMELLDLLRIMGISVMAIVTICLLGLRFLKHQ